MTGSADRYDTLAASAHVRREAERLLPVLTLTAGTRSASTADELVHEIAVCVAALDLRPEEKAAVAGAVRVLRHPNGYEVAVVAAFINATTLTVETRRGRP